jgi:hypothetical protein
LKKTSAPFSSLLNDGFIDFSLEPDYSLDLSNMCLLCYPSGTAAILAVGGSKPTVVATADGLIGVKKVMTVNITADHRIVYGAQAAEFLQTLKQVRSKSRY